MGLSSIFCCSVDTKDETDENKYNGSRPYKNQYSQNLMNSNKEVNSVHSDTDTIANTNDETVKNGVATASGNVSGEGNGGNSDSGEGSSRDNKDESFSKDNQERMTASTSNSEDNENIIAQQGNEDTVDVNMDEFDEDSIMELTRFQEGQYRNPETGWLLSEKTSEFRNKKCLILDLDETLVHSSFKYLRTADFVIPVEIDNQIHHVYVIKRPGVDEFLKKVGEWYEVVVFTASVSKYGNPLLDKLDIHQAIHHRLFRDSCYNYEGNFIKNLSQIGRPLNESIIIDNSPASYIFHPQHSVPISSWFSDTHDNELLDLLPFLHDLSKQNVDDVSLVLDVML